MKSNQTENDTNLKVNHSRWGRNDPGTAEPSVHHATYHAIYWTLSCNPIGQDSGYGTSMQECAAQD